MRAVAITGFAQVPSVRLEREYDDVEIVQKVVCEALDDAGLSREDIGFTCSGSSDYLQGPPFAFVGVLDALGAWPPISESHVEMDGAWALYEAWVRLQLGDIDAALVYAFGRSSAGDLQDILSMQLDPYTLAPLWPDPISLAALQARSLLETGRYSEEDWAAVAERNRNSAINNPMAQLQGSRPASVLMKEPYIRDPLKKWACPPISDGAAAVVLTAGDLAEEKCERPAWIRGIDHRIECHQPGWRNLESSPSTSWAAEKAGIDPSKVDVAELHAPFAHQELILCEALGLSGPTRINPSGGALSANPLMVTGLIRFGEAARQIHRGDADICLAHATGGPCLQHNMVGRLEVQRG